MQFKVPQFIDIEDKVFGPLTFKQFVYLAGGAGFAYLSFRILPTFIAIIVGPALVGFALALTFIKYNEKPFIHVVESFIKFYSRSRLYLWHKSVPATPSPQSLPRQGKTMPMRPAANGQRGTMNGSNLNTLSWSLDVIGSKK